jgi:hypothetical protein
MNPLFLRVSPRRPSERGIQIAAEIHALREGVLDKRLEGYRGEMRKTVEEDARKLKGMGAQDEKKPGP